MVLKTHQDKTHHGVTASLSVPWGEARGDGEAGWSVNNWTTKEEWLLLDTGLGLYYSDFRQGTFKEQSKLIFTFRYEDGRWEGADFEIDIL